MEKLMVQEAKDEETLLCQGLEKLAGIVDFTWKCYPKWAPELGVSKN